ncbi:LysE family translocator [Microvirga sp. TS319]|uniref:LysE family translocator n=1 Tax=Microvirga sp. TS319 TaxID=3241165 RepID=UPI00351A47B9
MSGMSAFLSGAIIGLAITIPVGPMSLLCIQRALKFGALAGFTTGLGAATVLVVYTTCAVMGFGPLIVKAMDHSHTVLSALSACLLLWLSARILRRTISLAGSIAEGCGALSSYCSAVACALFNPLMPALLMTMLPTLAAPEPTAASSVIAGVFAASVTWWLIVSGGVAVLRSRLSITVLNVINKASGLMLAALGLLMAANAFNLGF